MEIGGASPLPHTRHRMSRHFEVEDFSVSGPNHEEDVKRPEQNRLDAEKIASQNVRCVAVLFKTLEVDKVERFFRHRHTKSSRRLWLFFADWVLWMGRKSSCSGLDQSISSGRGAALRA